MNKVLNVHINSHVMCCFVNKTRKRGVFRGCLLYYARLQQFKNQLSLYCPLVDSKKYLTLRELDTQK